MAQFGLCGASYQSASITADNQILLNWYLEQDESGMGKGQFILLPTPGTASFATLEAGSPIGGVRGAFAVNGRTFFVANKTLYEVSTATGGVTARGGVSNDGLFASMCSSTTQLFFASGGIPYSLNLTNPAANAVPVATLINGGITVSQVAYSDGFFIALKANSQEFFISSPLDATTWDLTNFGNVSVFPDNILCMWVDHREIWLFGVTKTTVYFDSGAADFPFDVIPGAFIEQGIAAPASVVRMDNSVFWLGADERGAGIAWRAQQYSPQRISNHAIENEWSTYPTIADAIGYSFQIEGHTFWHLYFPSAVDSAGKPTSASWRYDAATGQWHKVGYLENTGAITAHQSRCHVYVNGIHLVGDWKSARVFKMALPAQDNASTWHFAQDVGVAASTNPIKRTRRSPYVSTEEEWIFHSQLQIDVEVGVGPVPALTTDGNALAADFSNARGPQMVLRFSDTAGRSWSKEIIMDCGQSGDFLRRAIARRLGRSRHRIYEISCTDPIGWKIVNGYLKAEPDFAPTERLIKKLGKGA